MSTKRIVDRIMGWLSVLVVLLAWISGEEVFFWFYYWQTVFTVIYL
jgi:hypothetical protein